jgi:hypothetical protein
VNVLSYTVNPDDSVNVITLAGFKVIAPSSTRAGSPISVTVIALDSNGNEAVGYTGTISFSSSDPKAGLPSSYSFTAVDQGSHIFSLKMKTRGRQTVTVTDRAAGFSAQASIQVQ